MLLCLRFDRASLLGSRTLLVQTETPVTCNEYVTHEAGGMRLKLEFFAENDFVEMPLMTGCV